MMSSKVFISLLLLSIILIAGCTIGGTTTEETIESEDEAADTLMNVSSGVEDVGSTLDDIDDLLG